MTYSEIENAYMHNLGYTNMQDYLKDNHNTIFYKNDIKHESPFVCGVAYGMVKSFINSNIHTEEIPTWLHQYIADNKDRFITCVDDSAFKWAKDFAKLVKKHVSVNCNSFAIGEDLFLDFFHGEYTFDPKEEDKVFSALDDVAVIIDENLKGKLAIFLD